MVKILQKTTTALAVDNDRGTIRCNLEVTSGGHIYRFSIPRLSNKTVIMSTDGGAFGSDILAANGLSSDCVPLLFWDGARVIIGYQKSNQLAVLLTNNFSTWTNYTLNTETSTVQVTDMCQIGSYQYLVYTIPAGLNYTYKIVQTAGVIVHTLKTGTEGLTTGYVESNKYWFIGYDNTDTTYYLYSYNTTSVTEEADYTFVKEAVSVPLTGGFLTKIGETEIAIPTTFASPNYYLVRYNTVKQLVQGAGSTPPSFYWIADELKYIATTGGSGEVYRIDEFGGLLKIADGITAHGVGSLFDGFILEPIAIKTEKAELDQRKYTFSITAYDDYTDFLEYGVVIFDDDDNYIFSGNLIDKTMVNNLYTLSIGSNVYFDFLKEIEEDGFFQNKTIEQMLEYVVGKYMQGLYSVTVSGSSTLYTLNYSDTMIYRFIESLAKLDDLIWYIDTEGNLFLNNGTTDSGVNVLYSAGDPIGDFASSNKVKNVSAVTLFGGNGLVKTVEKAAGGIYVKDNYPEIEDEETLLAKATTLLNSRNQTINTLSFFTRGKGQIYPGTQIDFDYPAYSSKIPALASSTKWFVMQSNWDARTDTSYLIIQDVLFIARSSLQTESKVIQDNQTRTKHNYTTLSSRIEQPDTGNYFIVGKTTGNEESDWTGIAATTIVTNETKGGHNNSIKFTPTATDTLYLFTSESYTNMTKDFWIAVKNATASKVQFYMIDAARTHSVAIHFDSSNNILFRIDNITQISRPYTDETMYHIRFELDYTNSKVTFYLDTVFLGSYTWGNYTISDCELLIHNTEEVWIDAVGFSFNNYDVDSNYTSTQMRSMSFVRNGHLLGLTYFPYDDRDLSSADFTPATLTTSQTLDCSSLVPDHAKAVYIIMSNTISGTVNAGNYVLLRKNGNNNQVNMLRCRAPPVAGYTQDSHGIVGLDADRKLYFLMNTVSGTQSVYVTIIGYFA